MPRFQRRRRRQRDLGSVELNLTAMLDMAFQILTFFVLTFRPAPIEGQLELNLPPPVPQTNVESVQKFGQGTEDVLAMQTLHLYVTADERGGVEELKIETRPAVQGPLDEANVQRLDQQLQTLFAIQQVPFDRFQIAVDGRLHYGELMKVIDVCHRQHLPDGTRVQKISFTELQTGAVKTMEGSGTF